MIRFPATGDKIGSLVINPGGPGESGIEAALGMVQSLPHAGPRAVRPRRLRPARGGGRRRRRSGATPTPTTTGCAPSPRSTTARRASRTSRTRPRQFVQRCVDKMGKDFLANVGTVNVAKDLDAIRAALGDDKLTYLGYSYGTRIGVGLRRGVPAERAGDDPRRRRRPQRRPDRGRPATGHGVSRTRSTTTPQTAPSHPTCPLGTDPAKAVDVYHSLVDPLVDKNNPTIGQPARPRIRAA